MNPNTPQDIMIAHDKILMQEFSSVWPLVASTEAKMNPPPNIPDKQASANQCMPQHKMILLIMT
jgi:hypothetical protein